MDELRRICAESTVFLRREAIAAGYDDQALARSRKLGVVTRVRRGAYIFSDVWDGLDARERHLVRAAAVRRQANTTVVISHVTAAVAHGLAMWDLPLDHVHVTRTDQRAGRRDAGVVQHTAALQDDEVVEIEGVPTTSLARTAVDVALLTDFRHAVCVLDSALATGRCSRDDLRALDERMRHVPGSLGLQLAIGFADGRAEAVSESLTRVMLHLGGLPAPIPQYEVRDRLGRLLGRVDFAWPELGVFLEFDGKSKYEELRRPGESVGDVVNREKRRERSICEATGWTCIRIVWADLFNPEVTCAMIRRALAHAA